MKMIKNLTKANIRKIEGMERREDLDFTDDGNHFRGFSYKGMPITTIRSDNITYLCIRVDYLENEFTFNEWFKTEEYALCDEFNGVSEVDLDKLIENLERVIAKVEEMNKAASEEVIDTTEIEAKLNEEITYAEEIIENFKKNFKWYEVDSYKLKILVEYLKSAGNYVEHAKNLLVCIEDLDNRVVRKYRENLNRFGYVHIKKDNFYFTEMLKALNN